MSSNAWLKTSADKNNVDTYFNAKFALEYGDVAELANYIINPGFVSSIFQNPSDWLSSLIYYPFDVTYENLLAKGKLQIASFQTNIECTPVNSGFAWFNLGEIKIDRYFNNYADYSGYTKISVWLPYYGFVDINPNEVYGKYLEFALSVDYNNGQAVYYIGVSDTSITPYEAIPQYASSIFENVRIISVSAFQLGYQIPLGSSNAVEVYRNILSGAIKAVSAAVGAYAMGAVGAGISTEKTKVVMTTRNPNTNRQIQSQTYTREKITDRNSYNDGKAINSIFEASAQTLSSLNFGANTDVVNNPNLLSNSSNSIKVVIYRPKFIDVDDEYNRLYGKPLGSTRLLGTLSGYTEINEVHIEGEAFNTATENEIAKLRQELLKGIFL